MPASSAMLSSARMRWCVVWQILSRKSLQYVHESGQAQVNEVKKCR